MFSITNNKLNFNNINTNIECYQPTSKKWNCIFKIKILILKLFGIAISIKDSQQKIFHIKKSTLLNWIKTNQGNTKTKNYEAEIKKIVASITIQRAFRIFSTKKKRIIAQKKQKAVITIQSAFRAHLAKKKCNKLKAIIAQKKYAAAISIQSAFRAHLAKKKCNKLKAISAQKKYAAAISIQSAFRARLANKKVKLRKESLAQKMQSAISLQAFIRSYLNLKKVEKQQKIIDLKSKIKTTLFIKKAIRKNISRIRSKLAQKKEAATTLQTIIRTHLSEKEFQSRRKLFEINNLKKEIIKEKIHVLDLKEAIFKLNQKEINKTEEEFNALQYCKDRIILGHAINESNMRLETLLDKLYSEKEKNAAKKIQNFYKRYLLRKSFNQLIKDYKDYVKENGELKGGFNEYIEKITSGVVSTVDSLPSTMKTRLGWNILKSLPQAFRLVKSGIKGIGNGRYKSGMATVGLGVLIPISQAGQTAMFWISKLAR